MLESPSLVPSRINSSVASVAVATQHLLPFALGRLRSSGGCAPTRPLVASSVLDAPASCLAAEVHLRATATSAAAKDAVRAVSSEHRSIAVMLHIAAVTTCRSRFRQVEPASEIQASSTACHSGSGPPATAYTKGDFCGPYRYR